MRVLGIETSCDETGLAVYDTEAGLLGHRLHSQVDLHAVYGGVVPELAARDHVARLAPMLRELLADLALAPADIDGIGYTAGPGLMGALLVGAGFGRSLAYAWQVPAIAVHHMEGHLLAPMLEPRAPAFPFVALLVSGGHSMLVQVRALGDYEILGTTLDDAAGEAFDKGAKMLGLPYPGGPALAALAESGDETAFVFPRPMAKKPGFDLSFSGLKTALAIAIQNLCEPDAQTRANLAASYQQAIVDSLLIKAMAALKSVDAERLVVAGGVGANRKLRAALDARMAARGGEVYYPKFEFCTDNGAMIAVAAALRISEAEDALAFQTRARWPLDQLGTPGAAQHG